MEMNISEAVTGNVGGLQKTDVGTSEILFDVSAWIRSFVKIQAFGDPECRLDYVFSPSSQNVISDVQALDANTPNAGAPDWVTHGGESHEIVPQAPAGGKMYLHVRSTHANTRVKVRKAQQ